MSFDVHGPARTRPALAASATGASSPARPARVYGWLATAGIGTALVLFVLVSLARAPWMQPPVPMPRVGPPFELTGWHLQQGTVTVLLWLSALAGGLGVAAGLVAAQRGARPPMRLLLAGAAVAVAILTVLPPAGSTDALDYAAFGRMLVLGHSPYVMVPWDLMRMHDAIAKSLPQEWDRLPTPYGPAATLEQFAAAQLGGASAARIVFWLKLCNAMAFGAVAITADRLLRSAPEARLRAHLLWTVNPLLIWQEIAAAHLDVLAAAAGMLGLIVACGWPAVPAAGHPRLGRVLAGGALIGLAADIKITYLLFAVGMAWALRKSAAACAAGACGVAGVLLPTYAWFGRPAVLAVLARGNKTTADNFYQLFSRAQDGFLMEHVAIIATVLVVCVAMLALAHLPFRATAHPAIFVALALSTSWLFIWQYQLPSYDVMIICLLILVPVSWLDVLVVVRLTAATIALMPGNPQPVREHILNRIYNYDITVLVPIVLIAVVASFIALCLSERWRNRPSRLEPRPELA